MSNHMHLECWSHEPHIVDDSWVGQHDEDLPAIRLALADRIVSGPASCAPGAVERARNLAAFIDRHPGCDIRVVDEAGNDRTADEPPGLTLRILDPDGSVVSAVHKDDPEPFLTALFDGIANGPVINVDLTLRKALQ